MTPVLFSGVSFLTPLDALFGLAAIVPVAALLLSERAAGRVARVLSVAGAAPAPPRSVGGRARRARRAHRHGGGAAGRRPPPARERARGRAGVLRLRHVAVDGSLDRRRAADAAGTREESRSTPACAAAGPPGRDRVDDRPDAAEHDAVDRHNAVRAHARAVGRDRQSASEPGLPRARDDVRSPRPARRVALLLERRGATSARRLHRRRGAAALVGRQAHAAAARHAGLRPRLVAAATCCTTVRTAGSPTSATSPIRAARTRSQSSQRSPAAARSPRRSCPRSRTRPATRSASRARRSASRRTRG